MSKMSDIRTLGKRLGQHINQETIILGRITGKTSDGMSTEITTTDNARINVTFLEPLNDNASDFIEVRGIVKSKSTMSCNNFVCFPPSMIKDFDADDYNTMVHMRCVVGSKMDCFTEI